MIACWTPSARLERDDGIALAAVHIGLHGADLDRLGEHTDLVFEVGDAAPNAAHPEGELLKLRVDGLVLGYCGVEIDEGTGPGVGRILTRRARLGHVFFGHRPGPGRWAKGEKAQQNKRHHAASEPRGHDPDGMAGTEQLHSFAVSATAGGG